MPFQSLGLGPKITRAIRDSGYTEPTPIQSAAIPAVLAGHDTIGIAQTGTGKTAAFVLPILERLSAQPRPAGKRMIRALVLSPTRELAVQTEENVRRYGAHLDIKHATVYGGVGEGPQIAALRSGCDIIVATPGRLIDLTNRGGFNFNGLEFLVLDEADRMLDMGFLPQIRQVIRSLPVKRQTLLFSATLSKEIETISQEFLKSPKKVQIGRSANPAETVAQFVYEVDKDRKIDLLIHLLKDAKLNMVLVFSRTRHGADKIAKRLERSGIKTATLHSSRSQSQRIKALNGFRDGEFRVLVATDIAARGIDVEKISHVVNFDFPPQPEDYVHRIGRTGRAHAIGDAISFVSPDDRANLRALERFIGRGVPRVAVDGPIPISPGNEPERRAFRPQAPSRPSSHGAAAPRSSSGNSQRPSSGSSQRPTQAGRPQGRPSGPGRPQGGRPSGPGGPRRFGSAPRRDSDGGSRSR